jgi:hypothetical protein
LGSDRKDRGLAVSFVVGAASTSAGAFGGTLTWITSTSSGGLRLIILSMPIFDQHVEIVLGLLKILQAILQLVPADVLDDVHLQEVQAIFVGSEKLKGLHLELSVVGRMLYVVTHQAILLYSPFFWISYVRSDIWSLRPAGL